MYRNSSTTEPYLLQLPGCPYVCTLENFKKLTSFLVPDDWQAECDVGFVNSLSYRSIFEITGKHIEKRYLNDERVKVGSNKIANRTISVFSNDGCGFFIGCFAPIHY